ncbi:MAG TPA: hypothetical protein VGP47_03155 [Parachlamydiaceae bacterium]|nr:hypothetical protein [Parachlamydiaceae bacterium]
MKTQSHDYQHLNYGIDAASKIAVDYYPLEKTAKISYRALDLAAIFYDKLPLHFMTISSQIKDLVLAIESTRFFCISFPLFFSKNGSSFFKNKTNIQCAEKISITSHLALKTIFGADRVGLIRLGIVGSYAVGQLSVFKWALEASVLMYNFFGTWEGIVSLTKAENNLAIAQRKIEKWDHRKQAIETFPIETATNPSSLDRILNKQRKWKVVKTNLQINRNRAAFKIGATASKFILIVFATSLAAVNVWTIPFQISVLSLGIISDAIGLAGFFYQQYRLPV